MYFLQVLIICLAVGIGIAWIAPRAAVWLGLSLFALGLIAPVCSYVNDVVLRRPGDSSGLGMLATMSMVFLLPPGLFLLIFGLIFRR